MRLYAVWNDWVFGRMQEMFTTVPTVVDLSLSGSCGEMKMICFLWSIVGCVSWIRDGSVQVSPVVWKHAVVG